MIGRIRNDKLDDHVGAELEASRIPSSGRLGLVRLDAPARARSREAWDCPSKDTLGGTTCLTLLAYYGLICFLWPYLSNTAS